MTQATVPRPALALAAFVPLTAQGPGAFFRDHPGLYGLSLAGALGTAAYAAVEARKAEPGRARWWALAGLTVTQAVGMAASRRRAQPVGDLGQDLDPSTGGVQRPVT